MTVTAVAATALAPIAVAATIPLAVTVAADPQADVCTAADTIFCDGFDGAPAYAQPILDPSFEATTGSLNPNPFWYGLDDIGPGFTPFYDASDTPLGTAHSGTYLAYGGGWGAASSQHWSQSVTIASGGARYLNFWRYILDVPTNGTATLTISVDDTAVSTLDVIALGADADWTQVSIDVSSYADAAEHAIKFDYVATGDTDGDVFVDDVTIDQTQGPASATPKNE